jgi:replication-associated recombination protein RarA
MTRLTEKFRPRKLSEIVGQPPVRILQKLVANPEPTCILLTGDAGVGKTSAAYALAHELGCFCPATFPKENPPPGAWAQCTGLFTVIASELSIDKARELFNGTLRLRWGSSSNFCVLVIEELERLSAATQVFLKVQLETAMPRNLIVVATSNSTSGLSKSFLQRFRTYHFSSGLDLLQAAQPRLREIWAKEAPDAPMPSLAHTWGYCSDDKTYSLRTALDEMSDHLTLSCV